MKKNEKRKMAILEQMEKYEATKKSYYYIQELATGRTLLKSDNTMLTFHTLIEAIEYKKANILDENLFIILSY